MINVVAYLNSRGVYHQNLLPESIYVLSGPNVKPLVWLTDFSMANHNHTNSRGCNDPNLIEKWYTSQPINTDDLCNGNLWSLGMLGIYIFHDRDIYDWIDTHADDETIDLCYIIRGRFGYGLERAHCDSGPPNPENNIIINDLLLYKSPLTIRDSCIIPIFDNTIETHKLLKVETYNNYIVSVCNDNKTRNYRTRDNTKCSENEKIPVMIAIPDSPEWFGDSGDSGDNTDKIIDKITCARKLTF